MSERWAQEFELRARALWTDGAVRLVTEGKDLPILPSNAPTLLRALGLLHRDASMPPPQVRKFLQLNHMIRLLRPPLLELIERGEPLRIVDAGCGLSYLTLSLAWCFRHVFRHPATLIGIDRDEARVTAGRATVAQLGLDEMLTFQAGAIESFGSRRFKLRSRTTRNAHSLSCRLRTAPSSGSRSPVSGPFPRVSRPTNTPLPRHDPRPARGHGTFGVDPETPLHDVLV